MAEAVISQQVITTADGVPLKTKLRRANRMRRIKALGLVGPLFLFIVVSFIIPIGDMLFRSVDNPTLTQFIPMTIKNLERWDGAGLPDEGTYEALAKELKLAKKDRNSWTRSRPR